MTPKEMAEKAAHPYQPPIENKWQEKWLERLVELIRIDEREACAQLCEDLHASDGSWCAKHIRARGTTA